MQSQHVEDGSLFDQRWLAARGRAARQSGARPSFLDGLVQDELLDRLEGVSREFADISIIAPGAAQLAEKLPHHRRAKAAISTHEGIARRGLFVDAPELPPNGADCLIVALDLEWANDLPGTLATLRNALRPDGLLLAAMLGESTLRELRHAWLEAETSHAGGVSPRVAPFTTVQDAGALMQRAGFAMPVVDTDTITVRYASAMDLLRELKALGLSNSLADRHRSIVTPRLLAAVCAAYESRFADPDGRVRATFQPLYLTGWAPHEDQPKPLRPGSAAMKLADALKTVERKLPRER